MCCVCVGEGGEEETEEVCVLCVCVGEGGEEATEEVCVLCVCRRGRGRGN